MADPTTVTPDSTGFGGVTARPTIGIGFDEGEFDLEADVEAHAASTGTCRARVAIEVPGAMEVQEHDPWYPFGTLSVQLGPTRAHNALASSLGVGVVARQLPQGVVAGVMVSAFESGRGVGKVEGISAYDDALRARGWDPEHVDEGAQPT